MFVENMLLHILEISCSNYETLFTVVIIHLRVHDLKKIMLMILFSEHLLHTSDGSPG